MEDTDKGLLTIPETSDFAKEPFFVFSFHIDQL
jgi:hypothetical protein